MVLADIKPGDDITLSGTVKDIQNGCLLMETANHNEYWVDPVDAKTLRPNGGGKRSIVRRDNGH